MSAKAAIAVGIPAHCHPSAVGRTLAGLRSTAPQAQVLLLGESATVEAEEWIAHPCDASLGAQNQLAGNAARFNLLARSVCADIYILFEAGAMPAPGWLRHLLATFLRIPRCGLTGPSTNRCWNEQSVVPAGLRRMTAADGDLNSTARAIQRRFGSSLRTLRPLHSLADFCYAVRREVIDAIGPADEGYPGGACWEMDYNIRAHRAGFLGVWTCGAYVERAPILPASFSAATHLVAGKQRYQDKFCGGHLRGTKSDYRDHCRGDACPNFAPPALVEIHPAARSLRAAPARATPENAHPSVEVLPEPPLVSCIMPTFNRRGFIPAALACFAAQDYPSLELIVVDDGPDAIADLLPAGPRIRYFRLEGKHTVGAKRNFACEQARGAFIAHWDDDDWYAPARVCSQIEAMRGKHWQASGTTTMYYLHKENEQAFRYTYRGSGCAWFGALLYTRSAWQRSRFESIQVGEDVRFLAQIPLADRLDLLDPALTIGTIHSTNTSPKITSGSYWSPESPEMIRSLMRMPETAAEPPAPLISCIMPTYNRRAFIALALQCFRAQIWPKKELIVIDDGTDPVGDLLDGHPGVRYASVPCRMTLGAKRNLACELARGELIAHWDDDDWYSPRRLVEQMAPILAQHCDVTGLVTTHVLEMPSARFWTLSGNLHQRMFMGDIVGGTLLFPKSLLQQGFRYPEMNLAEDAALIRQFTQRHKRVQRVADPGLFIYVRHGRNTWLFNPGRFVDPNGWRPTAPPPEFSAAALESYRAACLQAAHA